MSFFLFVCFCLIQHEYDKMVEEKDTELKLYKIKEQEQSSLKRALVRNTHQCWIMKWKGCFSKMSNLLACLGHTEKRGVVLDQCNASSLQYLCAFLSTLLKSASCFNLTVCL